MLTADLICLWEEVSLESSYHYLKPNHTDFLKGLVDEKYANSATKKLF